MYFETNIVIKHTSSGCLQCMFCRTERKLIYGVHRKEKSPAYLYYTTVISTKNLKIYIYIFSYESAVRLNVILRNS